MSRKSGFGSLMSDHLAADEVPIDAPPRPRTSILSSRDRAITDTLRNEKTVVLRLDPAECTIWPGNARDYSQLDEHRLQGLIQSIIAEGGNKFPVTVRRKSQGEGFELLVGTRRHWSVAWLRQNGYPEMTLLAHVVAIDDEAAFRLADIENREREDITDLERARNYKQALDIYYGGHQSRMADRLRISESTLSRLLRLADLPDAVVRAYPNEASIKVRHIQDLGPLLSSLAGKQALTLAAEAISEEQQQRRLAGKPVIEAADVVRRLADAVSPKKKASSPQARELKSKRGSTLGRIVSDRRNSFVFQVVKTDATIEEVVEAFRQSLLDSRLGLKP